MPNQFTNAPRHKTIPCFACGKLIKVKLYHIARNHHCYCNHKCRDDGRRKLRLEDIDFVIQNFDKLTVDDFMKRYDCSRGALRKRFTAYRKINAAVPKFTKPVSKGKKKVKRKKTVQPKQKKRPITIQYKPPKPEPKKFDKRNEDMTNKHYVKIDNRTWALRRKTA